jgi:glycerol-3-phosphate O-acyltransferase
MSLKRHQRLQQILPDIETWPIHKLYQQRKAFVQHVVAEALARLQRHHNIGDTIAQTVYQERIRLKETPWKVDPPTEKAFWYRTRSKLLAAEMLSDKKEEEAAHSDILEHITYRYADEIAGGFNKGTLLFARKFLYIFFTRLLNLAYVRGWGMFKSKHTLDERLQVYGEAETIRALFDKGTVVVMPTHFSNLDSILIGFAMDEVLGLPSFSYGAGLNLYNFGPAAYFMNRLGAYRVDRRKKNPVYLETLKAMSYRSIYQGVNSLFFPGGTRSRSGSLETKLKMGLIGTGIEAQRQLCLEGSDKKIFIVPAVLSYHFVIEAPYLIEQHLRITGRERYLKGRDGSKSIRQWIRYIWQFFSQKNDIVINFGAPIDVMGNRVDATGQSFDKFNRPVDIAGYFTGVHGVEVNHQREEEYTRLLAELLVARYHQDNIALHSHAAAFVAFRLLLANHPKLDLFEFLRLPTEDYVIPFKQMAAAFGAMRNALNHLEHQGKLHLGVEFSQMTDEELIRDGVRRIGMFHVNKPLLINKHGDIRSEDFHTLCYYHNRLLNYGLEHKIAWAQYPILQKHD